MNINGGPEELATFIRALNDEPVYIIEPPARERVVAPRRPAPAKNPNVATAWLLFALIGACILALISAHAGA